VSQLSTDVGRIGATGDLSARVSSGGNDELSLLAEATNKMLEALEHSQQERQESETSASRSLSVPLMMRFGTGSWCPIPSWWNDAVQRLFGYAKDALHAKWWSDHIHPEDQARAVAGVKETVAMAREKWSDEYRFRRAEGSYAHVYDRGYLIRDAQGVPFRMIGAMMDISQRKRTEVELQEAKEAAEAASRTNSEFLALICEASRGVPEVVQGDPTRLRQVVVNLVGNAIKFTKKGEIAVQLATESQDSDGVLLHFVIRDSGIGIARPKQHIIFDAFSQADSSMLASTAARGWV
jgi:PAS domain S-box-containing protein